MRTLNKKEILFVSGGLLAPLSIPKSVTIVANITKQEKLLLSFADLGFTISASIGIVVLAGIALCCAYCDEHSGS